MSNEHMGNKILGLSIDKTEKRKAPRPGIRILLINCSEAQMRSIRCEIERGKGFKVVGMARDVHQARQMVKSLNPDLLIMDILDPRSGGIGFLKRLQHFHPIPVILISPVSKMTFSMAVSAFEHGATQIIDKDTLDIFQGNSLSSEVSSLFEHIRTVAS